MDNDLRAIEDALRNVAFRETRRAISKALRKARTEAARAVRGNSPNQTLRRGIRAGTTITARARRGQPVQLLGGSKGNIGFTAVGVPSLRKVPPSGNNRAWFVAYSTEVGNPGISPRAQQLRRRVEPRRGPYMFKAVSSAEPQILAAFIDAFKTELKL